MVSKKKLKNVFSFLKNMPNQHTSNIPSDEVLRPIVESLFYIPLSRAQMLEELRRLGYTLNESAFGRRLRSWGLSKNDLFKTDEDRERIRNIIRTEILNINMNIGYRRMRSVLRVKHGILGTKYQSY
jgi:hypothetical protein